MTSSLNRRALLRGAFVGAGAVLAAGAVGRAGADPLGLGQLLAAGSQTVTLRVVGTATLTVDAPATACEPTPLLFTGTRTVRLVVAGTDRVYLRCVDFALTAQHPDLGAVALGLPGRAQSPDSVLTKDADGRLVETWLQSFALTVGDGASTLATAEPGQWTAHHTRYPPPEVTAEPDGTTSGGAVYTLAAPIRLGAPDDPGTSYGVLEDFHPRQGLSA
ncbi:hypothetical protein [Saccharothrix syringae]|uniref:hypothetical protein n=1 Tax=Saccharothrix syringae TaxID=103733 RepID=UPI00052404D8|nr:hypothetical protein [Saccharothrix syringae]